jgi:membrane-associated HD superfamily phosphohydrolase
MIQFRHPAARAVAAATTLLGAIMLAGPSFAASSTARAQVAQANSEQAMAAPATESPRVQTVDARIKELHRRLHITEAQKTQWDNLARVMRDNAQAMAEVEKQRAADASSMNAVDVVKSYSAVIDAHEDGMKKFVPAFENLYNSLSDAQKKTADAMFRVRARTEAKKEVSKAS